MTFSSPVDIANRALQHVGASRITGTAWPPTEDTKAASEAAGSATQGTHIAIMQTTAPTVSNGTLDAKASDVAGTITLTAANPVVTFNKAFATTPHCVVSSPSGAAFTYAAATGTLTLTGGANTNTATYICLQ